MARPTRRSVDKRLRKCALSVLVVVRVVCSAETVRASRYESRSTRVVVLACIISLECSLLECDFLTTGQRVSSFFVDPIPLVVHRKVLYRLLLIVPVNGLQKAVRLYISKV